MGRIKDMVGTFVVKIFLLFILNILGAFPQNKKQLIFKKGKRNNFNKLVSISRVLSLTLPSTLGLQK